MPFLFQRFAIFVRSIVTMKTIVFFFWCVIGLGFISCGDNNSAVVKPTAENVDSLYTAYKKLGKEVPMDVLIVHGNTLLERYEYSNALKDGAEAYRREPKNLDARLLYAKCLNNRPNRTNSDLVAAKKHFEFVLKKKPKDLGLLVQLAAVHAQIGDADKAFMYCNRALRIDKHFRDAYILKGKIYEELGNVDRAISSMETAIQQDPNYFPAYLYIGDLYQNVKNDPIAIEYFVSADQLRPNDIEVLYKLAYAYQTFNKDEEALQVYLRMQKLDPNFTVSTFQQGWIKQFHQNQADSAIVFYDMTLQKEPRYVEAWHNLGLIHEEIKKDKFEAIKCYRMALKYNKDFELSKEALDRLVK